MFPDHPLRSGIHLPEVRHAPRPVLRSLVWRQRAGELAADSADWWPGHHPGRGGPTQAAPHQGRYDIVAAADHDNENDNINNDNNDNGDGVNNNGNKSNDNNSNDNNNNNDNDDDDGDDYGYDGVDENCKGDAIFTAINDLLLQLLLLLRWQR